MRIAGLFGSLLGSVSVVALIGCGSPPPDTETESQTAEAISTLHVLETPPSDAAAVDTYYVTFFSYQTGANLFLTKQNSHTFAQFVHAQPDGAGGVTVADTLHISWMPLSGVVRTLGPTEPGENTEIDFELQRGATVPRARAFAWGPFRIPATIWQRAERQRDLLATGAVLYKASERDRVSRTTNYLEDGSAIAPEFLNCLAAVGDISPDGGTIVGTATGRAGTQEIVDHFAPFFVNRAANDGYQDRHRWLASRLNLRRFNPLFDSGLELIEERRRNAR